MFKKYFEFVKIDTVSEIDKKLLELPSVTAYYQNIYFELKDKYRIYSEQLDKRWIERYLYYKNEFEFTLNDSQIKNFIEKDLELMEIKSKLSKVENMLQKIENVLKGLDNLRWTLKSLIDWESFKAGNFNKVQ